VAAVIVIVAELLEVIAGVHVPIVAPPPVVDITPLASMAMLVPA
jgi:hypothetical protein